MTLTSFWWWKQKDDWFMEREQKGIKVFTKKSRWGKLKDSKAVMLVTASPEEMLKLIVDFDNYPNWIPRCKMAKRVANISGHEFIGYMHYNCPWPIPDRDCVVRVRTEKLPTGIVRVVMTSEPRYVKEKEGIVRIEQMSSTWTLVPKPNGTEVANEYTSNPGGEIPDWLTNTQSVDQPMSTFENIQVKVNKPSGQ